MANRLAILFALCASALPIGSIAHAQALGLGRNMPAALEHYRAGSEYLGRELWEAAAREFAAAIRREKLFTDAHYGLAQSYMGMRRYTSAIQAFHRFIDAARTIHGLRLQRTRGAASAAAFEVPAPALLSLGSAHFHHGDREAAERCWRDAVKVDSSLGEAWNNLAVLYAGDGRWREASTAVGNAERAGYRVNPALNAQIAAAP